MELVYAIMSLDLGQEGAEKQLVPYGQSSPLAWATTDVEVCNAVYTESVAVVQCRLLYIVVLQLRDCTLTTTDNGFHCPYLQQSSGLQQSKSAHTSFTVL
jgi:hypothetical protein